MAIESFNSLPSDQNVSPPSAESLRLPIIAFEKLLIPLNIGIKICRSMHVNIAVMDYQRVKALLGVSDDVTSRHIRHQPGDVTSRHLRHQPGDGGRNETAARRHVRPLINWNTARTGPMPRGGTESRGWVRGLCGS